MRDAPSPFADPSPAGLSGTELLGTDLLGTDLSGTVVVLLTAQTPSKAGDHLLLAGLVGRLTGVAATSVALDQVCPTCGEPGHGPLRVTVRGAVPSPAVHVSLARADGRVALAVTAAGPVGIDLESVADLARAPVESVLLSAAEADAVAAADRPAAATTLAAVWTAKEAVLKAAGVGLRVDPRDLTIELEPAGTAGAPPTRVGVLAAWPAAPFPLEAVHLHPLIAPAGTVGTVAVVSAARPALVVLATRAR